MKKPQSLSPQTRINPILTDWLGFISNDDLRLAIPVGPCFQADIPDLTGTPQDEGCSKYKDEKLNSSRWLGSQVWPLKGNTPGTEIVSVGKGRYDICTCASPGYIECVKRHILEKRLQLQFDLGPAFWEWKFNEMGQDVSQSWNLEEQKLFEYVLKMKPQTDGESFMKIALECFPSKGKQAIVSYYLNVYIPRRMSIQTRIGCKSIDTDNEDNETVEAPCPESYRKRYRADSNCKYEKTRYLTGRR